MKTRKIICPTCKQDMNEPPRKGWKNKDCPQCGQGVKDAAMAVRVQQHRVIEIR